MSEEKCWDCGALPGSPHERGCFVEQCAYCGGQAVSCCCRGSRRARKVRLPWSGEYPGLAECREFGWYARAVPGGWEPCGPDDPGSQGDLNRLHGKEAEWDSAQMSFIKREFPRLATL